MADLYWAFTIVNTALNGILIKPLFILWIILLCMARRRSDPARTGVPWLKAAMIFLVLTMLLFVIANALYLVSYNMDSYYSDDEGVALYKAQTYLSFVAGLFQDVTDVLAIICFVELGNGFLYILYQQRTTLQRVLRYVALGFGLLIFILSIARMGKGEAVYVKYYRSVESDDYYYDDDYDYGSFERGIQVVRNLSISIAVLLFVASLPVFAYAIVVVVKTKHNHVIKNSAVLLLVASIMNFLRRLWGLIYVAAWLGPRRNPPYEVISIVDPILNIWFFFIALVLLYVVCVRKQHGLWTTSQPWMHGAQPPALSGNPLPPINPWGQYPQQVVYVQQPAPGYAPQGQPAQGWQSQPQPAGFYYNGPQPQQPMQQQQTGGASELAPGHVANGFHQPQELKT